MGRNFGFRGRVEPVEIRAGSFYLIFVTILLVVGLALIHP
jgi:hypothetical protein